MTQPEIQELVRHLNGAIGSLASALMEQSKFNQTLLVAMYRSSTSGQTERPELAEASDYNVKMLDELQVVIDALGRIESMFSEP